MTLAIDSGEFKEETVDVSAKVIADLSLGIYRTPANALKELVSNSFDAEATNVVITTNFPEFDIITCADDGNGMLFEDFRTIMKRIGGSAKREKGDYTPSGRPIIGKIGIGLLAAGQICDEFVVISSNGSGKRFEAVVNFTQFQHQDAYKYSLSDQKVRIGRYHYVDGIREKPGEHYTKLILRQIAQGFRQRLKDEPESKLKEFSTKKAKVRTFEEFVKLCDTTAIKELSEYDSMIWEMAISCPVAYLKGGPVIGANAIPKIRRRLTGYSFHVFVDGLQLKKPLRFPNDETIRKRGTDYEVYEDIVFDGVIDDKRLTLRGYIYQQGRRILPPEVRGILIRLRNVGIGGYDRSVLHFPISVGPILQGLSGEIYVDEGLEDSLNIDRNGFRETDPHFLKVQELIWTRMSGWTAADGKEIVGIMTDARKRSRLRVAKTRANQFTFAVAEIERIIMDVTGKRFTVTFVDEESSRPVEVHLKLGAIEIFEKNPVYPATKSLRRATQRVLCFYELSRAMMSSQDKLDAMFMRLLQGTRQ